MNNRGVTLVELLVVVSIITILVVALGFSYQGWMGSYKVESATKTLYADLMDARSIALQRNHTCWATLASTTYSIAEDKNENLSVDSGETLDTFPKTPGYTINGAPLTLVFSTRGIISTDAGAIPANAPVMIRLVSTAKPDYDCLNAYPTRIRLGNYVEETGVCNEH